MGVAEFTHQHLEGDAVLQADRDRGGKGVDQAGDRGAGLGHGDKNLARLAIVVLADCDVALMSGDGELVRAGTAFVGKSAPLTGEGVVLRAALALAGLGDHGLGALGAVTIDGDRFEPQLPGLHIDVGNIADAAVVGHIDGFGNRARKERLHGGHHPDMAHMMDEAVAVEGHKGAVEYRQMLREQIGGALDGVFALQVGDDLLDLGFGVAQPVQGRGDGLVDQLEFSAADEPFVFDQGNVRFDAGGVAVHHKADGAGRCQHSHLGIAEAPAFAHLVGVVPDFIGGVGQRGGDEVGVDLVECGAVFADNPQHRFAVFVEFGERAHGAGEDGRAQIGLAGHQGGQGGGQGASLFAVVGHAIVHQQGAEIGVAEAERPEEMAVARDLFVRIAGAADDDLLGDDEGADGAAEGFDVKLAAFLDEFEQVEGGEIARRVVDEHVFAAGIRGVDRC